MTWWRREVEGVVRSGWTYAALWALSRALLAFEWSHYVSYIEGDVSYYLSQVKNATSWSSSLVEYPTPVAWAMQVLRALTGGNHGAFVWAFAISMLALDAAMARLTWRLSALRWRVPAVITWIVFVQLMGPIAYFRFDMAPAVLAGAGAFLYRRRPALAGTLIACGAALKLWPALLVLPLLGTGRRGVRTAVGFGVTGATLALAALLGGGWARLISPLAWQSERGLQIESLPATPLMWLRTASPKPEWVVGLSRYNAFEIAGPGVDTALQLASLLTLVGFLLAIIIGVRAAWSMKRTSRTVAVVMLAIILVMIDANKTLSPQYILWLGGPLAALIGGSEDDSEPSFGWPAYWALAGGALAFLTQVVYPLRYGEIVYGNGTPGAVADLVIRNVFLVAFTAVVCWKAWRLTRRRRPEHPGHESLEVEAPGGVA
ncbi:MAG TPA: glycosyltransferase 87 family protein [Propionibacteriaceae bacterium]|nr:glycosyltransferase 87 family protein [Propionibacteriaceae bacterium]